MPYGLQCGRLGFVKKTTRYKERCTMKRQAYLRRLRMLGLQYGFDNIVYIDETGFKPHTHRPHGWAKRGQRIFGDVVGTKHKNTNLIMARRGREWLAPMLFEGACTMNTVNAWVEHALLRELDRPSVVVMDNAPVHNKNHIRTVLERHGHALLPLPPYSPDFNPIENTFGTLKKRRQFMPPDASVDQLFCPES